MIYLFSFDDGVMIEVSDESKAHSVVGVARAFPSFFKATSCGFEFMLVWSEPRIRLS